ncbi:MAG: cupin domain-containing protein [Caulobacteraceae bacterium]
MKPAIVHHLGPDTIRDMARIDLTTAIEEPPSPIEPFDFHGCNCGIASFVGRPPWELHSTGDELLHVLAGGCKLTVRKDGEEHMWTLRIGDLAVVPKGCWHNNDAPDGVTMLFMTPSDGNRHSWNDPSA